MHIPESVSRKFGLSLYFDRSGVLSSHCPLCDVVVVGSPAGNHAGTIIGDTQPARPAVVFLRMNALLGIFCPGCLAKPHVIIKIIGYGHYWLRSCAGIGAEGNLDCVKLAYTTISD